MNRSPRRIVMDFPFPGKLPGANRGTMLAYGLMHMFCGISLIYPYFGVLALVPLGMLLFIRQVQMIPQAQVANRFLLQRIALILFVAAVCTGLWLQAGVYAWTVLYFTLLPLCIADSVSAFRGEVGLFYWRGFNAEA